MMLISDQRSPPSNHRLRRQNIKIITGSGKAILNGEEFDLYPGTLINILAGNSHDIINTGKTNMKLYTSYIPPNEPEGLIQKYKPN